VVSAGAPVVEPVSIAHTAKRQVSTILLWFTVSLFAVPLALMIHEAGHLFVGFVLGFHHLRLHYESVSYAGQDAFWQLIQAGDWAGAAVMAPFWKVALLEIAGPVASLATLLVAAVYVRRYWLAAAIGTVGIFRFLAPLAFVLVNYRLARRGLPPMQHWGMDEFDFWLLTGVSVKAILCAEIAMIVTGLVFIERGIRKGIRLSASVAMLFGMWAGVTLWYRFGPHILP